MSVPARSTMVLGLMVGVGAGLVVGLPVGFLVSQKVSQRTLETWRLVPIVVAAADVLPGAPLTMEVISQRSIPVRFASDAYVRPDTVEPLINKPVQTVLEAGTPLSRWMVDVPRETPIPAARPCGERARSIATASDTREVWRLVEALEQQDPPQRK